MASRNFSGGGWKSISAKAGLAALSFGGGYSRKKFGDGGSDGSGL
jgi:hypothetical protein